MSLDYDVMVWDPFDVGMRDDSFPSSQWSAVSAVKTHIDGDYVKIEVAGLGEAVIPAFATSVIITHGCSSTPDPIALPKIDLGGRRYWVDTVGATYFTIHVDSFMTVDIPFWWSSPTSGCAGGAGGLGYIEKTGISVDPDDFPYIVMALWGNEGYFIEVYETGAWNTIISTTPAPTEYGFVQHYIGDLGLGTITGIRLGVSDVPSAWVTYDFVEFHNKVPQYPEDMINSEVHQRRDSADYFLVNAAQNRYVGGDVRLLLNMEEGIGETAFDESEYENDAAFAGGIANPTWVSGGISLGGNDVCEINAHASLSFNDELTVIARCKPNLSSVVFYILDKAPGFVLRIATNGTVEFLWQDTTSTWRTASSATGAVSNGVEAEVAAVYDGTYFRIYVDGVASGTPLDVSGLTFKTITASNVEVGGSFYFSTYSWGELYYIILVNGAYSATDLKRLYQKDPQERIYVRSRYLRLVLDNGTNRDKVFSGVIQNAIPKQGVLFVDGQCLQMKINRGTINEDYVEEDLNVAVSDLAANFSEVTTSRVKAPVPNIPYTKVYDEVYGANALDEMASVPSKQTPYDMWIWELGYGQDLAFRVYNDADVRVCTVTIDQDVNVLRGVQRAEDIYDLSNKVVVIGGLMKHPEEDEWCDSIIDWTTQNIISFTAQTLTRTTGTHGLRIYADNDNLHYIHRDIPEFDASKYKRIVFDVWWDGNQENESATMDIQVYSAVSGYHYYSLIRSSQKGLTTGEWVRHSINLDDPMWGSSGSPEWDDIDGIRFFCVNGSLVQFTYYIDNVHFETDNEKDTATASIARAFEDRTYVYKDAKITKLADLQIFSEGLVRALQEVSDRFMIPVLGDPEFQRGRRVPVDIPYYDLDGNYYIAEVDHLFGRGFGYTCQVVLSTGRMDFSLEIAKSLAKDLRRESAGGVTL